MSNPENITPGLEALPQARIKPLPRLSAIWLVPLIAALAAGWLIFKNVHEEGPAITIVFDDGDGLQANQTVIKYCGITVGEVQSVHLTPEGRRVEVKARLNASAKGLAREGSLFWIVRPEAGASGLRGLETVVTGPYIQAQPGDGQKEVKFVGAEEPPILNDTQGGLEIVATTPHLPTLSVGSPVYYRGVEVGSVRYFVLANDSALVKVHLLIESNFASLVRTDTKFWNAGGVEADLRFFKIDFNAQTFKSLIIGGIAFATPTSPGPPAAPQSVFQLYEKSEDKWLDWSPAITIKEKNTTTGDSTSSTILNKMGQIQK